MSNVNESQKPFRRRGVATAVVVGASLSGLMTALTLAREGVRVTVLERSGDSGRTGAVIGIPEGLLARLTGVRRRDGRPELRGVAQTWHAAHDALESEADADDRITMHLGVNVIGIGQDWRSAWAVAEDDRRFSADVVVGADGYRSVARRHVAPDNPDAIFAGYALWIGMGSDDLPTRRPWPSGTTFAGDDLFPLASTPLLIPDPVTGVRTRRLTWAWTDASHNELLRELGCVTGSVVQRTLHGDEIPESDLDELAADARAHFESPWAEVIPDCIERRELIATPIAEYVPSRLVRDRVALVGDAAHVLTPMIGQGFAESLRDAEAIAAAVGARSTGGAVDGLRAYESRRLAAAREAVIAGQEISRAYVARARQAAARRRAPVGRA